MVQVMEAVRHLSVQAVKAAAAAVDQVWPPHRGVVILAYHRVNARSGLEVDLSLELFADQMERLAEQQRASTLDAALEALDAGARALPDPVVVTFDDGTADFADHVMPVLERHRLPVTLYLATDFIERQRPFPHGGTPLSWGSLHDALSTGLVTVGSHTHTHALLDRLDGVAVDQELVRSIRLIEDRLGVGADHFAYPKGRGGLRNGAADRAVRRRFRSAALAEIGANRYGRTDPYRLARSPIQRSDGMRWFARKLSGGMVLEGRLRRALNRRRYAGMTT